jgi:hypothetical protein
MPNARVTTRYGPIATCMSALPGLCRGPGFRPVSTTVDSPLATAAQWVVEAHADRQATTTPSRSGKKYERRSSAVWGQSGSVARVSANLGESFPVTHGSSPTIARAAPGSVLVGSNWTLRVPPWDTHTGNRARRTRDDSGTLLARTEEAAERALRAVHGTEVSGHYQTVMAPDFAGYHRSLVQCGVVIIRWQGPRPAAGPDHSPNPLALSDDAAGRGGRSCSASRPRPNGGPR